MIDCTDLIPRSHHESLVWLGKIKERWVTYDPVNPNVIDILNTPRTYLTIHEEVLRNAPGVERHMAYIHMMHKMYTSRHLMALAYIEAASRFLADGPKIFMPTEEQFESMEHVELHMPIGEFRMPYPAMAIRIPLGARNRLAHQFGVDIDNMPRSMFVRFRKEYEEAGTILVMGRFRGEEVYHLMTDQELNPDIEDCLNRRIAADTRDIDSKSGEFNCSTVMARSSLNLCLMLTHYGHRLAGPVDPAGYQKHRTKKHLDHFKHGDYLAVQMTQEIVVRAPSPAANNPQGPGTGIEVKPHWRRGHWRCYPGQAAKRAAGETVPLLFVRPCLVRRDRMVGEESETGVVYHGN